MNLNRLKLFVTVVNCTSLTKAATMLRMSPSSIWHQLALLQNDYHTKFYSRTNNGIELTGAGEMVFEAFKAMLAQEEDLKERVRNAAQENADSILRIGGSDAPSISILPAFLMRFQKHHSLTQIVFRTGDSWGIERMVLSSEVEIGMVTAPSRSPLLNVEFFSNEEMVAVVSTRHALAGKSELRLAEFARAPLVVRRNHGGVVETEQVINELMGGGIKPNIVARCESSSALKAVVEAGVGVGILNRAFVAQSAKDGKLKILRVPDFRMALQMFVIHQKDRPLSSEAQDLLALLRANRPPRAIAKYLEQPPRVNRKSRHTARAASSRPLSSLSLTLS
jgi:DNA-binding transcriptional LysR family regulator